MNQGKIKGTLRAYLLWPLLLSALFLIANVTVYFFNVRAGLIVSGFFAAYLIGILVVFFVLRNRLLQDLLGYAIDYNQTMKGLCSQFQEPLLITDVNGNCLWYNQLFQTKFLDNKKATAPVDSYIPELTNNTYPEKMDKNSDVHFVKDEIYYNTTIKKVHINQISGSATASSTLGIGEYFYLFLFSDETEIVHYIRENQEERLDMGFLYIDNYDESLDPLDEVRRSLLAALIDRKINKYMSKHDAISKKLEKDKYIVFFRHKYLKQMQADKFSIVDEIRNIEVNEGSSITISLGIAVLNDIYLKKQEYARSAIDIALARGGDQVVVKTKDNLLYYGGKRMQQEKNTRVKARVKAHALRESILAADQVLIMGHHLPDVDAVGSAVGIYRIAKSLEKPAHIIVNNVTSSLRPAIQTFTDNANYEEDMFIKGDRANEIMTSDTLLVIVDVNRPSYTDEPSLVTNAKHLVVLDHHRQGAETFVNPTLSYVEPFASSACEMVAEILQYVGDEVKITAAEADILYSGIMLDTNNFMNKPGVRTFEAVAFLRRKGADIMRIRKMFRSDISEYKVRAAAIQNTEIFMDHYAISICKGEELESPTIVASKIANELLDVINVKASFVLTEFNGKVFISARSIDEVNVQLIMERLGGGGHLNSAGTQIDGITLQDAAGRVRNTLQLMKEAGDLE